MSLRRRALLFGFAIGLASCDKVHFARIDVGTPLASRATSPLTAAEKDRAVSAFRTTATGLGLRCSPSKYPMITGSYDSSLYRLTLCEAEGEFTAIQLAEASDHVTVEIHQIGGLGEPAFFRRCRTRLAEALEAALPQGRVQVQYPYRWGRRSENGHKEVRGGPSTATRVHAAALRSIALEWDGAAPFLCVDVVVPEPESDDRFWPVTVRGEDPGVGVLPERAQRGQPELVPRSACRVGDDYDGPIVLVRTQQGGGTTVSLGPVRQRSPDEALVTVLTWGGGLTHTFEECVVRRVDGHWWPRGCEIFLQE